MRVPTYEEIKQTLKPLEVPLPEKKRHHVRTDVITPAQRSQKDVLKKKLSEELERRLRAKANRNRSKWDG